MGRDLMIVEDVDLVTLAECRAVVGSGLGKASKMPGATFGLSATECITGGRLQAVPGSVCFDCYAMKGMYQWPSVKLSHRRRMAALRTALGDEAQGRRWVRAMVRLIARAGHDVFRWHDSGDLQSVAHLRLIVAVAVALPNVRFWIPTRETVIVRDYLESGGIVPANLNIRVSAHIVGGHVPTRLPLGLPMSVVFKDEAPADAHVCPARHQGNACGDCRACWDPEVSVVAYPLH